VKAEIIAHRGFSARAPENTLASLSEAIEAGATSVEFDIQTAACGTPVLFHDPMLGRTTNGVGPVRRRPLGHLKELDAGSWFGPGFRHEQIPSQREALEYLRGRVDRVYQDIKGYREMEDLDRMVSVTREADMAGATVFISSNWVVMNRLRQKAPEIQRAYLVEEVGALPEALDRAVVDEGSILDLEFGVARENPLRVKEALGLGVDVATWTVDELKDAEEALALGIRRIATNQVARLLEWSSGLT
jgi:glycerophosphoryl diester phosphodiesterase